MEKTTFLKQYSMRTIRSDIAKSPGNHTAGGEKDTEDLNYYFKIWLKKSRSGSKR
ncbi:MAG TPA: hypothetical protein PK358_12465 [Spirochaetota bacterium]|nr:hypothetical protein [Spirochaetota bacterium]HPJ35645.1 hypothetical protein [Spirochaetota bacterium]